MELPVIVRLADAHRTFPGCVGVATAEAQFTDFSAVRLQTVRLQTDDGNTGLVYSKDLTVRLLTVRFQTDDGNISAILVYSKDLVPGPWMPTPERIKEKRKRQWARCHGIWFGGARR